MSILNPTDAAKAIIVPGPQHILQLLNPDGTPAGRAALAALTALLASLVFAILTGGGTYAGSLSLAQPTLSRIYQRDTRTGGAFGKGAGTVGLAVTLSAAVTTLDYRLRDADTAGNPVLQDWTGMAGAEAAGTASLSPSIPAGPHRYLIDVRANGDTTHAVLGTQAFGVGEVVAVSGQSIAVDAFSTSASGDTTTIASLGLTVPVASAVYAGWNAPPISPAWAPPADGGAYVSTYPGELTRLLSAVTGVVSGVVGYAYSGTPISSWVPGQANNTQLKSVLTAAGGKFGTFVWIQGTSDAIGNTSAVNWTAAYNSIVADLAATYPVLPFVRVITTIPAEVNTNDGSTQASQVIRAAAEAIAAATPATTATVQTLDATLSADGLHPRRPVWRSWRGSTTGRLQDCSACPPRGRVHSSPPPPAPRAVPLST